MKKFYGNYQDPQGDAIEGGFVTVLNPNGTLATLYSLNSTTSPQLPNPVTTDVLGYYGFYVEDGRYNIRFHKEGYVDQTLVDVEISDPDGPEVLEARIQAAVDRLQLTEILGPPGPGVPPGGTAGHIPKKRSNADYDIIWVPESVATGFRPEVDLIPDTSGVALMDNVASNNFLLLLERNVTIANPTGYQPGDRIRLIFQQNASGNHTISFGSAFQYSGNTAPDFSKSGGAIYRLDLDLIKGGKWIITPFIIQYNGDSTNIPTTPTGSNRKLVTSYPWSGTGPAVVAATMDATTLQEVRTAVTNAALGSKRAAAVAAVRAAFGTVQTLKLHRDNVLIQTMNYSGQLTAATIGSDLGVGLSTLDDASVMAIGDIDTGAWTATLATATRSIVMTAGAVGSGKMVSLANDTAPGKGIIPTIYLLTQRSLDGLQ